MRTHRRYVREIGITTNAILIVDIETDDIEVRSSIDIIIKPSISASERMGLFSALYDNISYSMLQDKVNALLKEHFNFSLNEMEEV